MNRTQEFIDFINEVFEKYSIDVPQNIAEYMQGLEMSNQVAEKPLFTESGAMILQYMQDNLDQPAWKAKDIAEGLFVASRKVSGAMRKLVSDGYVEKLACSPVVYALTEKGKTIKIEVTIEGEND